MKMKQNKQKVVKKTAKKKIKNSKAPAKKINKKTSKTKINKKISTAPKPKVNKKITPETPIKAKPLVSEADKKELVTVLSDAHARQTLINLGGENTLDIIKIYPYQTSDEEISRRLKVKISDVRSALNKLHGLGLISYDRKKDNETGWYSYTWSLKKQRIIGWLDEKRIEKKQMYTDEIEHYYCKKCGIDSVVEFEAATNSEFKCQYCNKELEFLEKEHVSKLVGEFIPSEIRRRGRI